MAIQITLTYRRVHPTLSSDGVGPGGEQLGDQSHRELLLCQTNRRAKPRAACADHQGVVLVMLDRVRP